MFDHALKKDGAEVYVHVVHGDITSDKNTNVGNVLRKIADMVKTYATRNGLRQGDFIKVIHLMDTDGAFVDSSRVFEDDKVDRARYFDNEIRCHNFEAIVHRNEQKSAVMQKLCGTYKI